MDKNRINSLDMAKGIGIILVVIGHSTFLEENVLTWISSFHMPLFFVLSGILIRKKNEESKKFSELVKRKAKSILFPYLTFSIIYLLIDLVYLILKQDNRTIVDLQRSGIEAVTLYGMSVLWFLPALFFGEVAFLLTRKHSNRRNTILITVAMAVITSFGAPLFKEHYPVLQSMPIPWIGYFFTSILRGCFGYLFISAGYFVADYLNNKEKVSRKELFLCVMCLLLSVATGLSNQRVDLHTLVINQPIFFFLAALSGSAFVILICNNIKYSKALSYLGKNSLIIMVTHLDCKVMIVAINLSYFVKQYVPLAGQSVFYICLTFFVLGIELVIIYVMNTYLPFILGRKRKKTNRHLKVVR